MLSISSLIDFLLNLLRDDDARAEFERDPQAVLARHGLEGVTAQDIRDVKPMLADTHGVSLRSDGRGCDDDDSPRPDVADHGSRPAHDHRPANDDPVREIRHVTNNHDVDKDVVVKQHTQNTYNEYNQFNYTDNSVTTGDGSTVIQDSFNQDNDGVDNKGGVINDSNVAGGDQSTVGNVDETTAVEDSFNDDASETVVVTDSGNDSSDNSTTVDSSFNESSTNSEALNNSYDADAPQADADATDAGMVPADAAA